MRDISYRVALGGIVSALCLVSMFLAGVLPALYLVLPMIAGMLLMIIAAEVGKRWALMTYISVSLLSMIITFDKEAALIFIMLLGHYPILRLYIEKLRSKLLMLIIKLAVFNVCAVSYFYVTVYIFGIEEMVDEFERFGKYAMAVVLLICNLIFLMYDFCLRSFYDTYRKRLMHKLKRKK